MFFPTRLLAALALLAIAVPAMAIDSQRIDYRYECELRVMKDLVLDPLPATEHTVLARVAAYGASLVRASDGTLSYSDREPSFRDSPFSDVKVTISTNVAYRDGKGRMRLTFGLETRHTTYLLNSTSVEVRENDAPGGSYVQSFSMQDKSSRTNYTMALRCSNFQISSRRPVVVDDNEVHVGTNQ